MDKCCQDICCLDKCHLDSWHLLKIVPGTCLWSLVKIEPVTAEILLMWTNVARTNVAWTNVTVTAGICCRCSQGPMFKVWSKSGHNSIFLRRTGCWEFWICWWKIVRIWIRNGKRNCLWNTWTLNASEMILIFLLSFECWFTIVSYY